MGYYTNGVASQIVSVPAATGNAAIDAVNINAALVSAGVGGTVIFPRNQTYIVGGKGAQVYTSIPPAIIDLNGSTIKVRSEVTAATTSAVVNSGATTIPLQTGQGALFQAGDSVAIFAATYAGVAFACNITVNSISADTLNVSAIAFNLGSTLASGSIVQHDNTCMYLQGSTSTLTGLPRTTVKNGIFDGNLTARLANGLRQSWSGNPLLHLIADSYQISDNIFKNGPCDGVLTAATPFLKASGNHLENVFGNGMHIGGHSNCIHESERHHGGQLFADSWQQYHIVAVHCAGRSNRAKRIT